MIQGLLFSLLLLFDLLVDLLGVFIKVGDVVFEAGLLNTGIFDGLIFWILKGIELRRATGTGAGGISKFCRICSI